MLICLSLAGLYVCSTLAASQVLGLHLPCGESDACELVSRTYLASALGGGLPFLGVFAYFALALLSVRLDARRSRERPLDLRYLQIISSLGTLSSVLLTGYSVFEVQTVCPYCFASGILFFTIWLVSLRLDTADWEPDLSWWRFSVIGVICLAVAICFQLRAEVADRDKVEYDRDVLSSLMDQELVPPDGHYLARNTSVTVPSDTLVVFADLTCPTCREELPELIGLARKAHCPLLFRQFPLRRNPLAWPVAVASEIAAQRGQFSQYVDHWLAKPSATKADWLSVCLLLGIDSTRVQTEENHDSIATGAVFRDLSLAKKLHIRVTPTIFLVTAKGRTGLSFGQATKFIRGRQVKLPGD